MQTNYSLALELARQTAAQHLGAHVRGDDSDESLDDLAQSIVGTESVVRLIMSVPFDEEAFEPAFVEAADEVGRLFFPDVQKRFITSVEILPEGALVQPEPDRAQEPERQSSGAAEALPGDLQDYFGVLAENAGVESLTSRLWNETSTDVLAGRLVRLRRHFPDGNIGEGSHVDPNSDLSESTILTCACRVAAGVTFAFPWGFFARQTEERARIATRYLVEREIRRAPEDLVDEGPLPLVALGLGPAIRRCGGSTNRLLALAFPDDVRPWMSSHVPPGFWDDADNRRRGVRWLIEDRLGHSATTLPTAVHEGRVTKRDFADAGLTWLLKNVYGWSVSDALAEAYTGLEPWERARRVSTDFWRGESGPEHAAEAIRWAVSRAGLTVDDLRDPNVSRRLKAALRTWHLTAALGIGFGGDVASALDAAFPGQFRPWEIVHLPRDTWRDAALRADAVGWLLGKLDITPAEVPQAIAAGRLTPDTFKDAGLDGVLRIVGSVWRAVDDAMPGRYERWELGTVPKSHWRNRKNVRDAVLWAMNRLDVDESSLAEAIDDGSLSASGLVNAGLGTLVMGVFLGDVSALCQVADVLPTEKRVPLSRFYRRSMLDRDGRRMAWRERTERDADTGHDKELERSLRVSRSIRRQRRRAL